MGGPFAMDIVADGGGALPRAVAVIPQRRRHIGDPKTVCDPTDFVTEMEDCHADGCYGCFQKGCLQKLTGLLFFGIMLQVMWTT